MDLSLRDFLTKELVRYAKIVGNYERLLQSGFRLGEHQQPEYDAAVAEVSRITSVLVQPMENDTVMWREALQKNMDAFDKERVNLYKAHGEGKWAILYEGIITDVQPNYQEAISVAYRRFGLKYFSVKEIEKPHEFTAWAAPASPPTVVAYLYRFHTDGSLRGEPNPRKWDIMLGAPQKDFSKEMEIRLLTDVSTAAMLSDLADVFQYWRDWNKRERAREGLTTDDCTKIICVPSEWPTHGQLSMWIDTLRGVADGART